MLAFSDLLRAPLRWGVRWSGFLVLYVTIVVTAITCLFVFRVLNRTTVIGAKNLGPKRKLIIISNHQSLIDSFLVGMVVYFPWLFWQPDLVPFHLADARNFMTHPQLRFFYRVLRVIPVHRNAAGERKDHAAYTTACDALNAGGMLHVFIEGTRSRDERLLPARPQVGALALATAATVRPVYITGLHAIHPYRKKPGDHPGTWWRAAALPIERGLVFMSRLLPDRKKWSGYRMAVGWRRFVLQTEWLLDIRAGHQVTVVIGDDVSPQEISTMVGAGDHREQVTHVANGLMVRLHELRSQTAIKR